MQEEPAFITIPIQTFKDILQEVQSLKDQINTLEARQNDHYERLDRDITYDRQRLARLERVEPQPLQRDRGDILRALIASNGGKMLAKEARRKMRLDKVLFSQLLAKAEDIEIKPYKIDKRQNLLVLK